MTVNQANTINAASNDNAIEDIRLAA